GITPTPSPSPQGGGEPDGTVPTQLQLLRRTPESRFAAPKRGASFPRNAAVWRYATLFRSISLRLVGRDQGWGSRRRGCNRDSASASPPPLAPPHKGEGNPMAPYPINCRYSGERQSPDLPRLSGMPAFAGMTAGGGEGGRTG